MLRFNSDAEVESADQKYISKQLKTFYHQGIYRLIKNVTPALMLIEISFELNNRNLSIADIYFTTLLLFVIYN